MIPAIYRMDSASHLGEGFVEEAGGFVDVGLGGVEHGCETKNVTVEAAFADEQPILPGGAGTQAMSHQDMQQTKMESGSINEQPETFIEEVMLRGASGTSVEPNSTPIPMVMSMKGQWMLMFHANVFIVDEQQTGARGGDKFFSTNWFMGAAQHKLGPGTFTGRLMLSLEPATISDRRYPLLFQQGETAFGKPIDDGQHPHDFIMELAALHDLKMGANNLLSLYFAPDGDPAIGPTAYATGHRRPRTPSPHWATTSRIPRTSPMKS